MATCGPETASSSAAISPTSRPRITLSIRPDLPDRGTTLLFGWPEPLTPASWPWQATWVVGDGQDSDDDELDLYESGEMAGEESLVAELADELSCSRGDAKAALRAAALALTRASLLSSIVDEDEDEEEEEEE